MTALKSAGEILMKTLHFAFLFFLTITSVSSRADIILMVHGYHGHADDWRRAGIVNKLSSGGWQDAGVVFQSAQGEVLFTQDIIASEKKQLTAHLPSEYPVLIQSQTLENLLRRVNEQYPEDKIILIGHSAGGVVARSALVRGGKSIPVTQLITIASPHLGTEIAEIGSFAAESPLAMITPWLGGGAINRSGQLFRDLQPEKPGSLLFLLNRQQHPRIDYVSLVRRQAYGLFADLLVPEESQHMEYVYALRGLARSISAGYGHALHPGDGDIILRLIDGPRLL